MLNLTRFVRVLWGALQLLMAVALLMSDGLQGLRTVSIVAAFPFMLLMVLMAFAPYRDLNLELWQREANEKLLRFRIEAMLFRESAREAQHAAAEEVHPTAPETAEEPDGGRGAAPEKPEDAPKP